MSRKQEFKRTVYFLEMNSDQIHHKHTTGLEDKNLKIYIQISLFYLFIHLSKQGPNISTIMAN